MKKFMKRFAVTVTAAAFTCMSLSGCGKMTAEKLLTKMDEAINKRTITFAECDMDMKMTFDISEEGTDTSMDIGINLDVDMWMNEDPVNSYFEGDVGIEMMGFDINTEMRGYMMEDGDVMATYMYTDMTEEWEYTEEEFDKEEYEKSKELSTSPMTERFSDYTLDEETVEVNEREAYVLRLNCTGKDLEALMGQTNNAMLESAGLEDISFEDLKIPAVYYVDKETYLPIKMELSIEGMDDMINDLLKGESDSSSDEKGLRGEEDSMTSLFGDEFDMSVKDITFSIVLDNVSYEPQSVPTVPDDIAEEAKASGSEDDWDLEDDIDLGDDSLEDFDWDEEVEYLEPLADGSYNMTLEGSDFVLNVPIPEGYEDYGYQFPDMVMYGSDDVYVYYELYDEDMYLTYMDIYSELDSETLSTSLGDAEVFYESDEYGSYCYAFIECPDCYICVTRMDSSAVSVDPADMQPLLDILSEAK